MIVLDGPMNQRDLADHILPVLGSFAHRDEIVGTEDDALRNEDHDVGALGDGAEAISDRQRIAAFRGHDPKPARG